MVCGNNIAANQMICDCSQQVGDCELLCQANKDTRDTAVPVRQRIPGTRRVDIEGKVLNPLNRPSDHRREEEDKCQKLSRSNRL